MFSRFFRRCGQPFERDSAQTGQKDRKTRPVTALFIKNDTSSPYLIRKEYQTNDKVSIVLKYL